MVAGKPGSGKSKRIIEMIRTAGIRSALLDGGHTPSQVRQLAWENGVEIRYVPGQPDLWREVDALSGADDPVHIFIDAPFLTDDDYRLLHGRVSETLLITVTLRTDDTAREDQLLKAWPSETYRLIQLEG